MLYILLAITFGLAIIWHFRHHGKNTPPRPTCLPILGSYLAFKGPFPQYAAKMSDRFQSPVVAMELVGNIPLIIINDYDIIKECLTMKGHVFSDRHKNEYQMAYFPQSGIVFLGYGDIWKAHRRFSSKTLRMFGVGKSIMEKKIHEELSFIVEEISKNVNRPYFLHDLLEHSTASVIYSVLAGDKLSLNSQLSPIGDTAFARQLKHSRENGRKDLLMRTNFGILKYIPKYWRFFDENRELIKGTRDVIRDIVEEHKRHLQEDHPRDFIDCFLVEGKESNLLEPDNLSQLILEFFLAGSGTSANALKWSLLFLLHHPEHLERIQDEIDNAIGSRLPTYKDSENMHFFRAFIQEIMRYKTIVPVIDRNCIVPVKVGNYQFPAQTQFVMNIWAVHHDEKIFHNAEVFNPERFLDKDGRFVKHDHVIPFSIGLRDCVGRNLAEMEIFLFLCGILQKFSMSPTKDLPELTSDIEQIVTKPLPFNINFTTR